MFRQMSRALLIGGFSANHEMLEPTREAIAEHLNFEDVDVMTLRQARQDPDEVRKQAKGIEVVTLSGGMGAVDGTRPIAVHGFGSPLPASRGALLARTAKKQRIMHSETPEKAWWFERLSTGEIVRHRIFHYQELGRISGTNSIDIAAGFEAQGVDTTLVYCRNDAYFWPSANDVSNADKNGVSIIYLPGQHDAPIIDADATMRAYAQAA